MDNELEFKTTDIRKERHIAGETYISAICTEDGTEVEMGVFNDKSHDKKLIKILLVANYKRKKKHEKPNLNVGDII